MEIKSGSTHDKESNPPPLKARILPRRAPFPPPLPLRRREQSAAGTYKTWRYKRMSAVSSAPTPTHRYVLVTGAPIWSVNRDSCQVEIPNHHDVELPEKSEHGGVLWSLVQRYSGTEMIGRFSIFAIDEEIEARRRTTTSRRRWSRRGVCTSARKGKRQEESLTIRSTLRFVMTRCRTVMELE